MPNKRVDDLRNKVDRESGQEWQKALGVKNLTTREWEYAGDRGSRGASDSTIKKEILAQRKNK